MMQQQLKEELRCLDQFCDLMTFQTAVSTDHMYSKHHKASNTVNLKALHATIADHNR